MERVNQFLDYMWTHPDAIIWYRSSDMILNVHSDTWYPSTPKACSRAGGYFFLGSILQDGYSMVHAWVGQKLLKYYTFKSFYNVRS